eukprot:15360094-Ditylum_brightwellii.AAC.1
MQVHPCHIIPQTTSKIRFSQHLSLNRGSCLNQLLWYRDPAPESTTHCTPNRVSHKTHKSQHPQWTISKMCDPMGTIVCWHRSIHNGGYIRPSIPRRAMGSECLDWTEKNQRKNKTRPAMAQT